MISGIDRLAGLLLHLDGGLEDRPRLHLVDLGIGDAEAAAAMAEHRVDLVQLRGARAATSATSMPVALATSSISASVLRQELVQRRVEQADRDRQAGHDRGRARRSPRAASAAILASAARRPCSSSARIISRTATMRSASKNMCSVRHRPMPSAPNSRAAARRRPASRRWRGPSACAISSAQPISVAKSPDSSGWIVGTAPSMTSPVEPSMRDQLAGLAPWCRAR